MCDKNNPQTNNKLYVEFSGGDCHFDHLPAHPLNLVQSVTEITEGSGRRKRSGQSEELTVSVCNEFILVYFVKFTF